VLGSPNDGIHDELELRSRDSQESIEAVDVDYSKKFEESDSMSVNEQENRSTFA